MDNKFKTWGYWRDEWINPFIIAVICAMIIRTFIVQPFKIPSTSMYPTLKVGDRIFVNKFLYGAEIPFLKKRLPKIREPKRGDIVVFISVQGSDRPYPGDRHVRIIGPLFFNKDSMRFRWHKGRKYIVKRLIGLPGDNVEIMDSDVYINGDLIKDPIAIKNIKYFNAGEYGIEGRPFTVPDGSYFVMGDNSANSIDSRFWGAVPKSNLTGKVFIIWWPPRRVQLIR